MTGDAIAAAEPVGDDPRAARHDPAGDFLDVLREPPHAPQVHAVGLAVLGWSRQRRRTALAAFFLVP
jgi:hypothetical protein